MSEVSELAGADVVALADILGDDTRIGRRFLDAGIGFGGGCLPKDIRAFSARAVELGARSVAGLLLEVDDINRRARDRTVDLARRMCGSRLWGRRVAVLGAAFKPFSDDVRDSPALDIANRLHAEGAAVTVYDPEANDNARAVCPELRYAATAEAALAGADLVLLLTDWPEFTELDPHQVAGIVRRRCIIDGRNRLDRDRWRMAGWSLQGIGRGALPALQGDSLTPAANEAASPAAGRGRSLLEQT
jgi:UDPglucose 6-dehydrogenase